MTEYLKRNKQACTFSDNESASNIDDDNFIASGNLFDSIVLSAEAQLPDMLEIICDSYKLNIGDAINIGDKDYYVDRQGYQIIINFTVPRSEHQSKDITK